uniref:Putative myosin heavy chain kinase b n=1 Tax=Nyssomyia neivai TaxID=330878 RepID=A0A1L8E506_9DIPT
MSGKVLTSDIQHEGEATCLEYRDHTLYSGGADGKIKIWDMDLISKREITAHEALIYAMTLDSRGRLFTSSTDGLVKIFENPRSVEFSQELMKSFDELLCVVAVGDDIYTGDDQGVVTWFVDRKIKFMYNLVEEVKSLAVEGNLIYTIRDNDCVITEKTDLKTGKFATKRVLPGKSPMIICGLETNGTKPWLVFCTRDGKGVTVIDNFRRPTTPAAPWTELWTKENAHDMIIKCMYGNTTGFYTGSYDGQIKKWVEVDKYPKIIGEANIGCCVNAITDGPDGCIFAAGDDGKVRKIDFN